MKKLQSNQSGFTIIEVLIVLAIAGLIMLIVFLAVPALQRNSRNTQRRDDISKLLGLVTEYGGNNNNTIPTGAGCSGNEMQLTGADAQPVSIPGGYYCMGSGTALNWSNSATTNTSTVDSVVLRSGATCDGTTGNATTTGAPALSVVALFTLEANTKQCQRS